MPPLPPPASREVAPVPETDLPGGGPSSGRGIATGLTALAAGHFAVDCCTGIWPVFKTLAALDLAKAGAIATAGSIIGNSLQVGFGILADRGHARALLVLGVLAAGSVTLASYTRSYPLLFLLVLATSVGSAAFHPTGTGAAGALSQRRTGVLVALFLVGGNAGYALSQILFTAAYRTAYHATALLLVIPALAAIGLMRFVPRPAGSPQSLAAWGRSVHGVLRPLASLFAVQAFATAMSTSLIFLLPDLLASRGADPWVVGGGGHFALAVGTCIGLVPAGHAADRFGVRRVVLVTILLTGAVLLALLGLDLPALALLPLVAIYGALSSATSVVVVSEGSRMLPGQTSGVSALLMGLPWSAAAFGPVVAGVLASPAHGGNPTRALAWLALCIPAALASGCLVRPRPALRAAGLP